MRVYAFSGSRFLSARVHSSSRWLIIHFSATAIGIALVLWSASAFAQPSESFLNPLGTIAHEERVHLFQIILILLVAVLPVVIGTPIIVLRYLRSRTGQSYRPKWEFDFRLETVMWMVPVLIVVALGVALVQAVQKLDPYDPLPGEQLNIDVISLDWKWLFLYPDQGVASIGELVIPAGQAVSFQITSDTVMQSFFIASLAGQIYAMPGMRTRLHVEANRVGHAEGEGTQYSGPGFPHQRFVTRAVDRADFDTWVESARASSVVLDEPTYHEVAKRSILPGVRADLGLTGDGPVLMNLPQADLFERVLSRYRTGVDILPAQQPGSPLYDPKQASLPDPSEVVAGFCGPGVPQDQTIASFFGGKDG